MYYFGEMPLHVHAPPLSAFVENHYCVYVAFLWYWLYHEICGVEFLSRRMCTHRPVHYIYVHVCTHTHTHLHVSSTWHRPWHAHVTLYRYNTNCHVHMHVGHMCHVFLHAAWPVCLPACMHTAPPGPNPVPRSVAWLAISTASSWLMLHLCTCRVPRTCTCHSFWDVTAVAIWPIGQPAVSMHAQ